VYGRDECGTFSIVASDVENGFWGVAVSTMPMAVGAVVPWAQWRVGGIATQAWSNYRYGPNGLALLRKGLSAEQVVARLTRADADRDRRQLGVVDRRGRAAAWTGSKCMESAIHVIGEGFTCQGNIVASEAVVQRMASAFERSRGPLSARMIRALQAAKRAGGDRRGLRSAAALVVHREPWYDRTWADRWVDLRVDDHRHPVEELARLVRLDQKMTDQFLRSSMAKKLKAAHARRRKC
jgi:uncharacterized Ntn-hydrolase superfamily protein